MKQKKKQENWYIFNSKVVVLVLNNNILFFNDNNFTLRFPYKTYFVVKVRVGVGETLSVYQP